MSTVQVDQYCPDCNTTNPDYKVVRYRVDDPRYPNVRIKIAECCNVAMGYLPDSEHYGEVDIDPEESDE